MDNITRIHDPKELHRIVERIHDCWFDVEDVVLDKETSTLSIRYEKESQHGTVEKRIFFLIRKERIPIYECFLKIGNVKKYDIRDKQQVGKYDFNDIRYNPELKRITIRTGVPIGLEIDIDRLEVLVEETEKIVDERCSISIF